MSDLDKLELWLHGIGLAYEKIEEYDGYVIALSDTAMLGDAYLVSYANFMFDLGGKFKNISIF